VKACDVMSIPSRNRWAVFLTARDRAIGMAAEARSTGYARVAVVEVESDDRGAAVLVDRHSQESVS
jgi:hypothetical protein